MRHRVPLLALAALSALVGPGAAEEKPDLSRLPTDPKEALAAARFLERACGREHPPGAVGMLIAIANHTWMNPGGGWFGPCHTRYPWEWLAARHEAAEKGITARAFRGPADL